jgi:mRNA-degrading endonuclease RelE of RelBE toxin-antitoxin system
MNYSNAVDGAHPTTLSTLVHAVIETSVFSRRADALLSRDERTALIDVLANNPLAGDVMPGLGGVRKLRFAPKGRGKSGAFRVIYYVLTKDRPILALLLYGKNEQSDLSPDQRKQVAALAAEMKRSLP